MLRLLRQVRSAVSLLNPDQVRRACAEPPHIGLVAATPAGYAALEDFLIPAAVSHERRVELMDYLHRAGDADAVPSDLVMCEEGALCPVESFVFHSAEPSRTIAEILDKRQDLGIALARFFPHFRKQMADMIVQGICRENALFAVATALPNVIPSIFQLPWAVSEFASDTVFITLNQVRMAFLIAACTGREIGFAEQKAEITAILSATLGWRSLARELAGKVPLGAGVAAKGAIAYAGTFVIGKGVERVNNGRRPLSRAEEQAAYLEGLALGRAIAQGATETPPPEA